MNSLSLRIEILVHDLESHSMILGISSKLKNTNSSNLIDTGPSSSGREKISQTNPSRNRHLHKQLVHLNLHEFESHWTYSNPFIERKNAF